MIQQKSTRESILELLKKQQTLSVSQLREHLNITEMAVRKHLIKMEGEQLVASRPVRQPMGRPVIYYSLTKAGENLFPTNYDAIAMEILKDVEESMGTDAIDQLFDNREKRMRKKYVRRIFAEDNLQEKVKDLIGVQNESGYMAEYDEIGEGEYTFSQYNCPISAIANKYTKPCDCELELFKSVLGTDNIERVTCIAKGQKSCKYVVKESTKETEKSHS